MALSPTLAALRHLRDRLTARRSGAALDAAAVRSLTAVLGDIVIAEETGNAELATCALASSRAIAIGDLHPVIVSEAPAAGANIVPWPLRPGLNRRSTDHE